MGVLDIFKGHAGEKHPSSSPKHQSSGTTNTPTSPSTPSRTGEQRSDSATTPSRTTSTNKSTQTPSKDSKTESSMGDRLSWEGSGGGRDTGSVPDSGKKQIGTAGNTSNSGTKQGRDSSITGSQGTTRGASGGQNLGSGGQNLSQTDGAGAGSGVASRATGTNGSETPSKQVSRTSHGTPNSHAIGTAGHARPGQHDNYDPEAKSTTQDHQILGHKTHDSIRHQEEEEVKRVRNVDRHLHHVQIHEQPLHDREVRDEIHHERVVPTTEIMERHSNLPEEHTQYAKHANRFTDSVVHGAKERTVVDLGEETRETVHHHTHNIIQPILEREIIERHRIHTVIPTNHTVHEAAIVHNPLTHNPLSLADFKSQGGTLGTGLGHMDAAKTVMRDGECDRQVSGVGEKLAKDLNLKEIA